MQNAFWARNENLSKRIQKVAFRAFQSFSERFQSVSKQFQSVSEHFENVSEVFEKQFNHQKENLLEILLSKAMFQKAKKKAKAMFPLGK